MNYNTIASQESIEKTIQALNEHGIEGLFVQTKEEALEKIKTLIPQGVSVMNGSSRTLEQIGFIEYLKSGTHGWNNLHETIFKEQDPIKQAELRKQSVISDVYLGSVHAISEEGEVVIASASGSQLPHIVFTSQHVIFVVGTQKITPTLEEAITRLKEYVFPLEDKRAKDVGYGGSAISKIVIINSEPKKMGRKVQVIFVNEELGF